MLMLNNDQFNVEANGTNLILLNTDLPCCTSVRQRWHTWAPYEVTSNMMMERSTLIKIYTMKKFVQRRRVVVCMQ